MRDGEYVLHIDYWNMPVLYEVTGQKRYQGHVEGLQELHGVGVRVMERTAIGRWQPGVFALLISSSALFLTFADLVWLAAAWWTSGYVIQVGFVALGLVVASAVAGSKSRFVMPLAAAVVSVSVGRVFSWAAEPVEVAGCTAVAIGCALAWGRARESLVDRRLNLITGDFLVYLGALWLLAIAWLPGVVSVIFIDAADAETVTNLRPIVLTVALLAAAILSTVEASHVNENGHRVSSNRMAWTLGLAALALAGVAALGSMGILQYATVRFVPPSQSITAVSSPDGTHLAVVEYSDAFDTAVVSVSKTQGGARRVLFVGFDRPDDEWLQWSSNDTMILGNGTELSLDDPPVDERMGW